MSNINYTIGHEAQDSDKEWFSPPQVFTPSRLSHYLRVQEPLTRAGIISATAGSLTAHLLGGGILSTAGGAMAGAVGAKKISERKREKKQRDGEI
ncbi:hypothetical protein K4K61_010634 [Colletotrichum sp. SAR11_59]|nr:hypothetical protein K4K61_010634 [Colletotrichum sp. SAR11_59]